MTKYQKISPHCEPKALAESASCILLLVISWYSTLVIARTLKPFQLHGRQVQECKAQKNRANSDNFISGQKGAFIVMRSNNFCKFVFAPLTKLFYIAAAKRSHKVEHSVTQSTQSTNSSSDSKSFHNNTNILCSKCCSYCCCCHFCQEFSVAFEQKKNPTKATHCNRILWAPIQTCHRSELLRKITKNDFLQPR